MKTLLAGRPAALAPLLLAGLIAASACAADAPTAGAPPAAPAAPTLKVLQLNVWQEGTSVAGGLEKIADVILASGADLVAFSEVRNYKGEDWHDKIMAVLKKKAPDRPFFGKFAGGDVGLISRFPVSDGRMVFNETKQDTGSIAAWTVTLPGGKALTVCSAHLDYQHYELNWVRGYHGGGKDGWGIRDADGDGQPDRSRDAKAILEYGRLSRRDEATAAFLAFAAKERASGRPMVLCGDFNEGSHLDWTAKAKDAFGHYGAVLPFANSQALAKAGFKDAFRAVHPDEVAHPGFTWPATAFGKDTTSWAPLSDERDRMDFIYLGAGLKATAASVVGPRTCFIGKEKVDDPGKDSFVCDDLPWPSDHKGVLVEMKWGK